MKLRKKSRKLQTLRKSSILILSAVISLGSFTLPTTQIAYASDDVEESTQWLSTKYLFYDVPTLSKNYNPSTMSTYCLADESLISYETDSSVDPAKLFKFTYRSESLYCFASKRYYGRNPSGTDSGVTYYSVSDRYSSDKLKGTVGYDYSTSYTCFGAILWYNEAGIGVSDTTATTSACNLSLFNSINSAGYFDKLYSTTMNPDEGKVYKTVSGFTYMNQPSNNAPVVQTVCNSGKALVRLDTESLVSQSSLLEEAVVGTVELNSIGKSDDEETTDTDEEESTEDTKEDKDEDDKDEDDTKKITLVKNTRTTANDNSDYKMSGDLYSYTDYTYSGDTSDYKLVDMDSGMQGSMLKYLWVQDCLTACKFTVNSQDVWVWNIGWHNGEPIFSCYNIESYNKHNGYLTTSDFDKTSFSAIAVFICDSSKAPNSVYTPTMSDREIARLGLSSSDFKYQSIVDEWTSGNALSESNLTELLPDKSNLNSDELTSLNTWISAIEDDYAIVKVFRVIVQLLGVALFVWDILFYLAYWLDRLNTFIDIPFLMVVTLGKLSLSETEESCTYGQHTDGDTKKKKTSTVNHSAVLKICLVTAVVAFLVTSGILYKVIAFITFTVMNFAKGV